MKICTLLMAFIMCFLSLFNSDLTDDYRVTSPTGLSGGTTEEMNKIDNADFYVSPDGNDNSDGSFTSPFATIERAKQAVRNTDKTGRSSITIALMAGDYNVKNIDFTAEDSGTSTCPVTYCAYGDDEVIINGGITLQTGKFSHVTDVNVLNRLGEEAKKNVICYNLFSGGITKEDYGKIYAIGSYNTAAKYTGDTVGGIYCELFVNDRRMNIARYPDSGYLESGEPVKVGQCKENQGSHTDTPWWATIVNPEGDTYAVDTALADRINAWQTLDDVWVFGYPGYDWADASSPIENFDYDNKTLTTKYVSMYGIKQGAPYYFFNVLEELNSAGEWYLDRDNGILYYYPDDDFENAVISLSLSEKELITGNGVEYLTLEGFTLKGTRSDGINIKGNNITVKNCTVKNISGNAVVLEGYNNLVTKCEISRTGKGGIYISGGDRETLTPGNSKADNNLIHDWSEIYQTYQPAVSLSGVGNTCSHNEIYNSPHEAITYSGNNHTVEYNLIHDVCLLSSDAGAIYSGRRWDWYGTTVRYNCIYNIGSEGYEPDGIYFDDALSGQTCYGNLLINIPKNGILIGGGRDITVKNNVIVNAKTPICYDNRAIEGVKGGWFTHSADLNSDMWTNLFTSPWKTEIWKNAYPQMQLFSSDFNNTDDPDFVPNPAYSDVSDNLIVSLKGKIGDIADEVYEYGTVENNAAYKLTRAEIIFTDWTNGDYSLSKNSIALRKLADFNEIPVSEMGRY